VGKRPASLLVAPANLFTASASTSRSWFIDIESGVSKATFAPSPSGTNPPGADLHSPAGCRTG